MLRLSLPKTKKCVARICDGPDIASVLGHFGHGHFGHGRFGQDISATDISANGHFGHGHFGHGTNTYFLLLQLEFNRLLPSGF